MATTTQARDALRQPGRLSPTPKGRIGLIVAASLATGLVAALALVAAPFIPAKENVLAGVVLLAFALGWSLLAVLSIRFSDQPQRWGRQLGEVDPEVVGLPVVGRSPHLAEQLGLTHQLSGSAGQRLDDAPFGRGQVNRRPVLLGPGLAYVGRSVSVSMTGRSPGLPVTPVRSAARIRAINSSMPNGLVT